MLYTLHSCGHEVPGEHLDWLLAAARAPGIPPGLYDGLGGAAWALLRLGRPDEGAEVLARALAAPMPQPNGLASGKAGLAIALLDFAVATGDRAFADQALSLGRQLAALPSARTAVAGVRGLLDGRTGIAALHLRLYAHTGDEAWTAAARQELTAELDDADWTDGRLLLQRTSTTGCSPTWGQVDWAWPR
ncbi:hypothetical protein GXW82_16505 [Streptacidiphilus sp. 4-A2]|nr:hypothetical protein [Streptacidiphilus sp. 4-A2]